MALNMSRRKKTGDDDDIPMAPMIDCVFLLLIFFMVSAVMRVPRLLLSPYPIPLRNMNSHARNITSSLVPTDEFLLMIRKC